MLDDMDDDGWLHVNGHVQPNPGPPHHHGPPQHNNNPHPNAIPGAFALQAIAEMVAAHQQQGALGGAPAGRGAPPGAGWAAWLAHQQPLAGGPAAAAAPPPAAPVPAAPGLPPAFAAAAAAAAAAVGLPPAVNEGIPPVPMPCTYGGSSCSSLTSVSLSSDDIRTLSWSQFPALKTLQLDCPSLVSGPASVSRRVNFRRRR